MRLPKVAETRAATVTTDSSTTSQRIVSDASIAPPEQDSAGGTRVFANKEKSSDSFANNLIKYVLTTVWPDGIVLHWVEGREGETTLQWNGG